MDIPGKDFFTNNEVVLVGYSKKPMSFSKSIYNLMTKSGLNVYPYNPNASGDYDIKVYNDLTTIEKIPETAYVLLNPKHIKTAVDSLIDSGIKKILFHEKKMVSKSVISSCDKSGIEVSFACPFMIFGKGFHKIHAFFARKFG